MMAFLTQNNLITLDATLIFQIVNTSVLLLIVIGVPVLIVILMKFMKSKNAATAKMDKKMETILNKIESSKGD